MLEENPEDLLARADQQHSIMGTDKADSNKRRHHNKKVEVGWTHAQKTREHCTTGAYMEPPGQKEERKAKKYLEARS